jgi:hypothetical protein
MKFSGRHFPKDIILTSIRSYLRYKLSYREIKELIAERGIDVDHSTLDRWVVNYALLLAAQAQHYKRNVGVRWRFEFATEPFFVGAKSLGQLLVRKRKQKCLALATKLIVEALEICLRLYGFVLTNCSNQFASIQSKRGICFCLYLA